MSTETNTLPDVETVAQVLRRDWHAGETYEGMARGVLALLAPRVIEPGPNQMAELDALPPETVLRWSDGVDVPIVIEKGPTRRWYETACAGSPSVSTVVAYNVPWTVLYLPA